MDLEMNTLAETDTLSAAANPTILISGVSGCDAEQNPEKAPIFQMGARRGSFDPSSTSATEIEPPLTDLKRRRSLGPLQGPLVTRGRPSTTTIDSWTGTGLSGGSAAGDSRSFVWGELSRSDSIGSFHSFTLENRDSLPVMSKTVTERVRLLVQRFITRTERFKEKTVQPPTPSIESVDVVSAVSGASDTEEPTGRHRRLDSFIPGAPGANGAVNAEDPAKGTIGCGNCRFKIPRFIRRLRLPQCIDSSSNYYLLWLLTVSLAFLYNGVAGPLRTAFRRAPIYPLQLQLGGGSDDGNQVPEPPIVPEHSNGTTTFRYHASTSSPLRRSLMVTTGKTVSSFTRNYLNSSTTEVQKSTSANRLQANNVSTNQNIYFYVSESRSSNQNFSTYTVDPYLSNQSASIYSKSSYRTQSTWVFNGSLADNFSRNFPVTTTRSSKTATATTATINMSRLKSSENLENSMNRTNSSEAVHSGIIGYFPGYETDENRFCWWIADYICDLIYILDIFLVKSRVGFLKNGIPETDRLEVRRNYMSKSNFKLDSLSLLPLDLLYLIPAINFNPLVRLPRLLKIQTFWEFYDRLDKRVSSAYFVRVARILTYMMYLIHLETCGLFAISVYIGIGTDGWVYDGTGIAYIHCMYLATKTATSIGNNVQPITQLEYMFMTFYWLAGVFIFAMLIGQIRDIFQAADANHDRYRKAMDQTSYYMKSMNVPKELQSRVKLWFTYNWEHSKTLDENSLLEALPKKMRTDLAIHVHFNTLSKVNLFQDCDKNLLYDLVLKLKSVLYLPGDYICRKGEVGTEMYIVMMGHIEVVGGPNNSIVFATLKEGSVFGEISLLALSGGNRRTADVRAKGYSQLFILSKVDFEEAMSDYPEAQKILRKKAKKLLSQNAKHETKDSSTEVEEVIKSRQGTPKLLKTVIRVVNEDSRIPSYLGLRRPSSNKSENEKNLGTVTDGTFEAERRRLDQQTVEANGNKEEYLIVEQTESSLETKSTTEIQVSEPNCDQSEVFNEVSPITEPVKGFTTCEDFDEESDLDEDSLIREILSPRPRRSS